jgi:hypothetical protein
MEHQKMGKAIPKEVFQAQQYYLQAQIDYMSSVTRNKEAIFAWRVVSCCKTDHGEFPKTIFILLKVDFSE